MSEIDEPIASATAEPADPTVAAPGPLRLTGRSFLAAVTLLTILPVPARAQRSIGAREVAASAPWFPVVGALLGLLIGLVGAVVADHAQLLGGAIVVVLVAGVTGALHLDGLADSADALGARGGSRERRLEIMRDSATGVYGTVVLAGWFLLVLAGVVTLRPETLPITLAIVLAVARTGAVSHAYALRPARPGGLGAGFAPSGRGLALTVLSFVLVLVAVYGLAQTGAEVFTPPPLVAFILIGGFATLSRLVVDTLAARLLGGRTGDTIGASIAFTEAVVLVAAALSV